MSIDSLMADDIYIVARDGKQVGPVKASVQGNKVIVTDASLVIEEGGKILRPLPNGNSEVHTILEVAFHNDPSGGELSHYTIKTRKDSSLVPTPSVTTINISNSQGIQIGNQNVQNIIGALETLCSAVESSSAPKEAKADVKSMLKAVLSHPVTVTILGSAAAKLIAKL